MSDKFKYKYSAPTIEERREIDSIRNKYLPKDESMTKIERLRYLDGKVKNYPIVYSLSFGIGGSLFFGCGLTFFLEWTSYWYVGIPFALIGVIFMILAYPVYNKILNKYKKKYGEEIINLSNELLNDEEK